MLTLSPSQQPSRIVSVPADIDTRLLKLDSALTSNLLLEVMKRGYEARIEATPASAPTAAGILYWLASVHSLRTALVERHWSINNNQNCPIIISPDKSVAIVVMTGNSDTGKEFGNPTNQADKGVVLGAAVQRNRQYELFENAAISELQKPEGGTQLWVLLYHVENGFKGVKGIRTELSFPSSFQKKKIVGWSERIILRSISTISTPLITPSLPVTPIEVVVERKTGT